MSGASGSRPHENYLVSTEDGRVYALLVLDLFEAGDPDDVELRVDDMGVDRVIENSSIELVSRDEQQLRIHLALVPAGSGDIRWSQH